MPASSWALVKRELVLIIRNRRLMASLILGPILICFVTVLMGVAMSTAIRGAAKSEAVIYVINLDRGEWSMRLLEYLEEKAKKVVTLAEENVEDALAKAMEASADALIVIPQGFTANLTAGRGATVEVYVIAKGASMASAMRGERVVELLGRFSEVVRTELARKAGVPESFVEHPYNATIYTVLPGPNVYRMPPAALQGLGMAFSFAPLIMVGIVATIAATAFAEEKEDKTLELLLSQPVSRTGIALAKIVGTIVIGVLATIGMVVAYAASMGFMYKAIGEAAMETAGEEAQARIGFHEIMSLISYAARPEMVASLVAATLVGMVLAAALTMMLASLAADVRSAQSLIGFIWVIIMGVMYTIPFMGLPDPPLRYIVGLIPFAVVASVPQALLVGDTTTALLHIAEHTVLVAVALYALARLLSSEYIVTGHMLLLRRLRRARE